ncbi:extracellular aspartic proteinase [Linnemannia elongata]|nr:hypothetical protein BGZ88_011179 [Linnemannia elongata]KAG0072178.1 hypothetical protein BGZ89_007748 [Linnemannia elongata]KAH7048034.1 extracellular aspartic proteinase [Linnemannia elongata]KAK5821994.1 extracellular aspartic proteinase [Linnemannia elongata]
MRITALVTLAAAVLAFTDASPIARRPHPSGGHSVPLTRNANYKHNTRAQIAKLNKRYPGLQILAGSTGHVPLTDVSPDLEYYGTVAVGTPAQNFKLDFDTGSSDIWFPSSSCTTTACKAHNRFYSSRSTSYQADGRKWSIAYGDGSTASGILGSDLVNVGGISVRQTIGLATRESSQFGSSPEDGLFGLGFNTIESVSGVKTFLDNAIAAGALAQPVVSVFLPSERLFNGQGGEYLFGGIDSTKYTGSLTYVPVTQKGYWQILVQDASYNGVSLGQTSQGIVDTGTTLIIVGDAAAAAIHSKIPGSVNDPNNGWLVPCSASSSTANIGFKLGGVTFNVPVADLAYEDLGDGSGNCFSGVQGGQDGLWILGDVFIKNNYCVFSQTSSPSIGIAPLAV